MVIHELKLIKHI